MREVIDQIKSLIISNYNKFLEENGYADRFFFESEKLRAKCKESLKIIYPLIFSGKNYDLNDSDFDEKYSSAIKEIRFTYKTIMNPSLSLQNDYKDTWLTPDRISEIGWDDSEINTYRARYLEYLKTIGRSPSIVNETSRSSIEIIKKIGDPKNLSDYFVKGLVVGSVQSGKTSNFNAVVNSSIDVGYKLIIVLSGIMEDLRKQTQIRTEKEVEGRMIAQGKFLGVGEIASFGIQGLHPDVNQIIVPTSRDKDFNRNMKDSDFSLNQVNILICKKNTSVLQNLLLWLKEYLLENNDKHAIPFLIIDDEADNASINNLGHKGKDFANKINGHIRALLALFNRKTYIGYTATPFANILQDWNKEPENKWIVKDSKNGNQLEFDQVGNLFPDDFIELLIPPSNYIGPKNFFETRIEEVKKIEPLLAKPISDYIDYFPERVESFPDGSLEGVNKYINQGEFLKDPNAITKFGTFQNYREVTRATTKYDSYPVAIPKSLDEAIKCFILSIAIRLTRRTELKQSLLFHPHNTMLIHISRFSDWQCRTKQLIIGLIDNLRDKLNNDSLIATDSVFKEFERIWVKYYADAITNIKEYLPENYEDEYLSKKTFLEVRDFLISAIDGIDVKAVNTVEKDVLDYENGEKKYIVIGGNKLSRGFTLEGLSVNYFIRNTTFADTLLQMGRWFGYRPGYLDCCKLFTTKDTFEKFDQCTWTIEELEEEFRKMASVHDPKKRKKPKDFATKVLTHPGTLKITRPAVLKNTEIIKWSYDDQILQTTEFILGKKTLDQSWSSLKRFYTANYNNFETKNDFMMLRTSASVLNEFLDYPHSSTLDFKPFQAFLKLANELNKLTTWTIAIRTKGGSDKILSKELSGFKEIVQLTKRRGPEKNKYYKDLFEEKRLFKGSGRSANIITAGSDFSITLTQTQKEKAEQEFNAKRFSLGLEKTTYPEYIYRALIPESEGVLVIYLMDLNEVYCGDLASLAVIDSVDLEIPLIGYAIGVPPFNETVGGEYLVNKHILNNIKENPTDEELISDEEADEEFEGVESEL